MSKFVDPANGETARYIPINLIEGETSGEVTLNVYPEQDPATLRASSSPDATIWAKIGAGVYQDLSTNPLDLSPFADSFTPVTFKVEAAANVPGVTRLRLTAGIGRPKAAAWEV